MTNYITLSSNGLRLFCHELFESYGFSPEDAAVIADVILTADLQGVESHGVNRLIRYHKELLSGFVDVNAKAEIVLETPVSAVIDARKSMGQTVAVFAMDKAIEKAKKTGVGMVSVRNSNHFGIAGYYTARAVKAGFIGFCTTNTEAICAPTFSKKAMLGTNPIAFAMPAVPVPFSFDAATSAVPLGKLEVYRKNNEPLPENWAVDENGNPTRDAASVIKAIEQKTYGGILPLGGGNGASNPGGHKGYGLAVIADICAGILSGGVTSNHINVKPGETGICHYFSAVDYGVFGDKKELETAVSRFLAELRAAPPASGCRRVYTHGEKEAETMARRVKEGVPVNVETCAEIGRIAREQGVVFDVSRLSAPAV
ncbi:MAG: Ldh family oxidoreductase [Spirochaetaceae bacterium]|jgi:LDH2 family malate/lactate/ureidoglycolate dehydrogenase|nr:Ldh family oxidoreductase [Spirochaetaceae bacterium]